MFDTVLCDLDGVVWLAHQPIDGSPEAVEQLRRAGCRVLFVTNNSNATISAQEDALARIGIPARGDVVTSAVAAALMIERGQRVLVSGGPGVVEAMESRGVDVVVNDGQPTSDVFDAVVVGLHRDFDYRRLTVAARAVRAGARLVGTNADPTYPTPSGLDPGGGSILAAVATAAGVQPEVAGKPSPAMATCVIDTIERGGVGFDRTRTLMVGDRADTDGAFAAQIGCPFALVRSGSTPPDQSSGASTLFDVGDLAAVVDLLYQQR